MLTIALHSLITNALPLLCGVCAALLSATLNLRRFHHVAMCIVAILGALCLQYACFLVLGGVLTGDWPTSFPLAGLAYAFVWFCVVAIFTSVPLTFVSYAVTASIAPRWIGTHLHKVGRP